MFSTIVIVLPVFGVILLGYLIGRTRLFSDEGIRGLTNFVFYVAMPMMLFRAMARLDHPDGVDLTLYAAYYIACLILYAVAMVIGRLVFRNNLEEQALLGMSATFSNTVLLGIPLVLAVFGDKALLPIMLIVTAHPLILITIPTVLIELHRGGGGGWTRVLGKAGLSLLKNPLIVAMVAGLLWGQAGWAIPGVIDKLFAFAGAAGPPAALFAVGASLTAYKIAGDLREVGVAMVLKLVCLPALVFVMCHFVFAIDPLWTAVATLNSAMPVGVNTFILSRTYDTYIARAASGVLLSTAVAWLTATILIALLLPTVGG